MLGPITAGPRPHIQKCSSARPAKREGEDGERSAPKNNPAGSHVSHRATPIVRLVLLWMRCSQCLLSLQLIDARRSLTLTRLRHQYPPDSKSCFIETGIVSHCRFVHLLKPFCLQKFGRKFGASFDFLAERQMPSLLNNSQVSSHPWPRQACHKRDHPTRRTSQSK